MYLLVSIANNAEIQVWVQGEKIRDQWQFDDGTPIPTVCPISEGTDPNEIYIRAIGPTDFLCHDAPSSHLHHYSCEYHLM